jgi:hypothetical protein
VSICTAVSYSISGIAAIFDSFSLYLATDFDCTPVDTMATLLLQSLQRIPDVAESRSRHLIPLFLKFMGYEYDDGSIFRYLVDKLSYFLISFEFRSPILDAIFELQTSAVLIHICLKIAKANNGNRF